MKTIISTPLAPKAIGPYSQGVLSKDFVFFSGQIAIDPQEGKFVGGGITEQTKQVLKNIDNLLKSQNLTGENVVKTTVFLTDMANFAVFNAEYANFFTINPPARSTVGVLSLPMGALVEIEVIAAK